MLVGRVFAAETGVDKQFAQVGRRDFVAGLELDRCVHQALRRADARQQRRGGGHDDARRSGDQRMQGAGAGGGDADVRRHAAVGVDLVRGKAEHRAIGGNVGQPFERRHEERHVADRLLEVAVAWHHIQHHAARHRLRGRRDIHGLGRRIQAGDRMNRRVHAAAENGVFEEGADVEGSSGCHGTIPVYTDGGSRLVVSR